MRAQTLPTFSFICLATFVVLLASSSLEGTEEPKRDPKPTVLAKVLGKEITENEAGNLSALIVRPLIESFVKEHKLEPAAHELDQFARKSMEKDRQQMLVYEEDRKKLQAKLDSETLSPAECDATEAQLKTIEFILQDHRKMEKGFEGKEGDRLLMEREMGKGFVRIWKVNQALFEKYGGRVIFQQFGPEPLDAYRDFLKQKEREGAFELLDKKAAKEFWKYYTDEKMHVFASKETAAKAMETPWWMMEEEEGAKKKKAAE